MRQRRRTGNGVRSHHVRTMEESTALDEREGAPGVDASSRAIAKKEILYSFWGFEAIGSGCAFS